MFRLEPYLTRMAVFLAAVTVVAGALFQPLARAFTANAPLNGLILGVLLLGVLYAFRQVVLLRHGAAWITAYKHRRDSHEQTPLMTEDSNLPIPRLLAPMAAMLGAREGPLRLTTGSMRSMLDSIASRLDESRALARYLIGLLIFLGLLGTFWGLLLTINSVSDVIGGLKVSGGELTETFARLKDGLAAPLTGMGTAFSSSLFGLGGSLVLGFLDLQSGQAQNRFYNDLEEWLSGLPRLTTPASEFSGNGSVPDYVQALLEQTAEGLDSLRRTLARGEEDRISTSAALIQLSERLTTLSDQMQGEQALLTKLAQNQVELHPVLGRLSTAMEDSGGFDEATRGHIRNIEVYLTRLLEETSTGRRQATEELRSEIKLLARTIAAGSDKAQGRGDD